MPRISKISAQKNGKRVNIYLDGEYATSLDLIAVTGYGLKRGMELTSRDLEDLLREHHLERLQAQAGRFLSYRPRSEKETRRFLNGKWRARTGKREHGELVDRVIEKLRKQGLVDDPAFARWWVEQRQTFRPKGVLLLRKELREKGVDRQTIDAILATVDEVDSALRLRHKLSGRIRERHPGKAREKLIAALKRRGFRWETIERVIDESGGKM